MSARRRAVQLLAGVQRKVPYGVALTFDDGPSPNTAVLLDLLRGLDVRATFFVLGEQVREHPELMRRMRAEGHGIGSRARSHHDIEEGIVALQLALGRRPRLFRPPHGHLELRVAIAMRRARLDSWLWTIDTEGDETIDHVVERCRGIHERDVVRLPGAVHLDAVARIVELVRARELDFVAL